MAKKRSKRWRAARAKKRRSYNPDRKRERDERLRQSRHQPATVAGIFAMSAAAAAMLAAAQVED